MLERGRHNFLRSSKAPLWISSRDRNWTEDEAVTVCRRGCQAHQVLRTAGPGSQRDGSHTRTSCSARPGQGQRTGAQKVPILQTRRSSFLAALVPKTAHFPFAPVWDPLWAQPLWDGRDDGVRRYSTRIPTSPSFLKARDVPSYAIVAVLLQRIPKGRTHNPLGYDTIPDVLGLLFDHTTYVELLGSWCPRLP